MEENLSFNDNIFVAIVTSTGGLIVPDRITRCVVIASAVTWFI
jgi:hypothetical protein